jgi:hypothetical protein
MYGLSLLQGRLDRRSFEKTIVRVASVFSKKMTKILGRRSVSAYFEGVRLM